MTRERHDQFAKDLFAAVLEPLGNIVAGQELLAEPLKVDISFEATGPLDPEVLEQHGLPGRLVAGRAYFEPYRHSLEAEHLWNAAAKLSMSWLAARRKVEKASAVLEGALWVVTPSAPEKLVREAGLKSLWENDGRDWWALKKWPTGVYQQSKLLPLGLVVLDELPEDRQTLTLRLMGRGRTLKRAVAELKGLAEDDPLRTPVLNLLEKWRIIQAPVSELDPQEQEVVMNVMKTYQQWSEERRQEGRQEGRLEGMQQGNQRRRAAASTALQRFWPRLYGPLPEPLKVAIESCADADQLEAAMNALATASSEEQAQRELVELLANRT
jgi:hypothetical protein